MIRSSARLRSKAVTETVNSPGESKSLAQKCANHVKKVSKYSKKVKKKSVAERSGCDPALLLNSSVTTRSGKKMGLQKHCPSQPENEQAQSSKKKSPKASATHLIAPTHSQACPNKQPQINSPVTESNRAATQPRVPLQSNSRKFTTSKQSSEKKKPVKKKNDRLDATVLQDVEAENDQNKKPIVLLDWVIKPVPNCHGICVEGQIEGQEDFWHSTAIAQALNPKLVVTASGSLYQLKKKMNKLLAYDYGISKDLAKAFANGFPPTWKDLIKDYYHIMEQSITVTEECMSPEKFQALKTRRKSLNKTVLDPVDIHTILTPTGLLKKEMNRSELTTTRSGRMSLPPLAGWAGQHYVKVPGENSVQVSFTTDTAKQALGKETIHALALSKRGQKMLCQSTVSKSLLASSNSAAVKRASSTSQNSGDIKQATTKHKSFKPMSHSPQSDSVCHIGKENFLDISLQPEVSLSDCLSPARQSLRNKDSQGAEERQSNKSLSKSETTALKKQALGTALACDSSSQNSRQMRQSKRNTATSENSSKTNRPRVRAQDNFTHITSKTDREKVSKEKDSATEPSANAAETRTESSQTPGVKTQQSATGEDSARSKPQSRKNSKKTVKTSRKRKAEDVEQMEQNNTEDGGKAKKQKLETAETVNEDSWTVVEKNRFYKAQKEVDSTLSDYWSLVSERVGSKSVAECQLFHKELLQSKTVARKKPAARKPAKPKQQGKGREKGAPIHGGKNTLKRKQAIRDFLDDQNDGYEDDPFEGTPFVKMKHVSLLPGMNIDFNKDESEIFGTNHNAFTPVSGKNPFDTPGLKFKAQLASVKKIAANQTEAVFQVSPQTVDMRKHDICIKHIMDQKKKALPSKVVPPQDDLESSILPIKSLFPGTPRIFMDNIVEEAEEDDDDDDDDNQFKYYFSDDD